MRQKRLILALTLLLAAGCGAKNKNAPANLSGKVTYKGQAVGGGTITFFPKDAGGVYSTSISADGTYNMSDLPTGDLQVAIETDSAKDLNPAGPGGAQYSKAMGPKPPGWQPTATGTYVKIPAKYAKKETSGLSVQVQHGKGTKDFDLAD